MIKATIIYWTGAEVILTFPSMTQVAAYADRVKKSGRVRVVNCRNAKSGHFLGGY
jgi:hypothetical protein